MFSENSCFFNMAVDLLILILRYERLKNFLQEFSKIAITEIKNPYPYLANLKECTNLELNKKPLK